MTSTTPYILPLYSQSSQSQLQTITINTVSHQQQKANLRTLSSFIRNYNNKPSRSTTSISIPIPSHPLTTRSNSTLPSQPAQQPNNPLQQPSQPSISTSIPASTPATTTMAHTTTTVTTRPSLLTRLRGGRTHRRTYETNTTRGRRHAHTHTHAQPVHHHHRKPSLGDKISGAMLKLKGSLTHRPGVKAAGTRRMRGTDGRGSHY